MKFDSSSVIQTEVAKAFSSIWEKLMHLEEENKRLKQENETLRMQNEQLQRERFDHPRVELDEDSVSVEEQNHSARSIPPKEDAWEEDDDELRHEERYANSLLQKTSGRTNAPLLEHLPIRTNRTPRRSMQDDPIDDLSLGPMSPTKIIENDRLVRVKMFEEALKEQKSQRRRSRSRSRPKSRTPSKKRSNSYVDESISEDEFSHSGYASPNKSRTPRGTSSKRLVPGGKLKSHDFTSFAEEAYSRARLSPRGSGSRSGSLSARGFDQNSTSKNSSSTSELELPVVKRITVFRNGDVHHMGEEFTLNMSRFTSFYQFVQMLNEKMYMGTPIRKLFEVPDHTRIRTLDDLRDRQILIAVGGEMQIKTGSRYPSKIRVLREQYGAKHAIAEG